MLIAGAEHFRSFSPCHLAPPPAHRPNKLSQITTEIAPVALSTYPSLTCVQCGFGDRRAFETRCCRSDTRERGPQLSFRSSRFSQERFWAADRTRIFARRLPPGLLPVLRHVRLRQHRTYPRSSALPALLPAERPAALDAPLGPLILPSLPSPRFLAPLLAFHLACLDFPRALCLVFSLQLHLDFP